MMSECTCAEAIAASERRRRDLPDGAQLFPRVASVKAHTGYSEPIFEEKSD